MPTLALIDWLLLGGITLLAGMVQTATGFGFGLVSVPFFLLVLDSLAAIQISIALVFFNGLLVVPRLWAGARRDLLRRFALGTLIGLPIGLWAWLNADLLSIKTTVAALILALSLRLVWVQLAPTQPRPLPGRPPWAGSVGVLSGVMSVSLAMPGPAVMIYLGQYRLDREIVRSTLVILFVFSYGCSLAVQATIGQMSSSSWLATAVLVPLSILGGWLGHWMSRFLSPTLFRNLVLFTLLATGCYMLYQSAVAWELL